MKLHVRSLKTKKTIEIEIADSSSLFDLKTLISGNLVSSSLSLSLNQRDELVASSSTDSLQSLGLASGDLLFYSKHPNPDIEDSTDETLAFVLHPETPNSEPIFDVHKQKEKAGDKMKMESALNSLKRMLYLERERIKGNLGFLMVAVHAVFLDSGFVPQKWNSASSQASLRYTVPEIDNESEAAILRFSAMMNQVIVYGNLEADDIYRLHLNLGETIPLLGFFPDVLNEEEDDEIKEEAEKELFDVWKAVKDALCFPLLIDIRRRNGLPLPACFATVPADIKLRILELLPGVDVARIGCVDSETRCLASNDEIWRRKLVEEFGMGDETQAPWRKQFVRRTLQRREQQQKAAQWFIDTALRTEWTEWEDSSDTESDTEYTK